MSGKPIYLISFNRSDEQAATYLQQELLRIFRNRVEFRISTRIRFENWRDWIRRTLDECRGVIALWSKYSLPSKWIYVEVGVCAYEGKRLFNLVLDPQDADDTSGRRLSLRLIEPADAAAENDWYVKLPRDASHVLYMFMTPDGFTKLTRLQVVLAPNDRYDLTFRDFAVVDL